MSFDPYSGQEKDLVNVPIALTSVAFVLVTARLVTTYKTRGWYGAEDYFIVVAFFSLVVLCVILAQASKYGFGKHVAEIQRTGGDLLTALKYYYLSQIFYRTTITINKLAFLFLYLRIFATTLFRRICLTLIYTVIASGLAFIILTIFQCTPIEKAWKKTAVQGHCVNLAWFRWTWASFNLFTDLVIFGLPMPVISRLQMSLSKKVGLAIIFVIGFFICLTTALRMQTLVGSVNAKERSWESAPANIWSFIEAAVGVICACLISLRKLLSMCWPDSLRSSKKTSDYQAYGSRAKIGSKRHGPPPGSRKLNEGHSDEEGYRLESGGGFAKHNGTTHGPDGKLLGASDVTVIGASSINGSEEHIMVPELHISVRRDISVSRESF